MYKGERRKNERHKNESKRQKAGLREREIKKKRKTSLQL